MILLYETILVTRNARDKIQVAIASLSQDGNNLIINRSTGQYEGKMSKQPELIIEKGKAKRSILQQAELQYNSIINKYLDKGYKKLTDLTSKSFSEISSSELNELVATLKTDQSGNLKVMLAKDFNKCQNSVLQKRLLCSRKLNGVRMMVKFKPLGERTMFFKASDEIKSISRGGKDYDVSSTLIREELIPFFEKYSDLILDGELYVHGMSLQKISGIARLETWESRCEKLEYWIYDIASDKMIFDERLKLLEEFEEFFKDSIRVKILEHVETNSWSDIQRLHDKWVSEGFEGAVARKPDKVYEFGKRSSTMIKIKQYQEESFRIIDYSEKLRDEDFCFILETKEGKVFEAKPIGDREMKDEYLNDMENIIGHMGDVKFFEWSQDNIPLQPVFMAVRYDLELD